MKDINEKSTNESFTKLIYIILIFTFFLLYGLFDEKLTKTKFYYKDEKGEKQSFYFKYQVISLCFSSLCSFLISSFKLKKKLSETNLINSGKEVIKFKDKLILGTLNSISRISIQKSILYLDYVIKTIGKSCKSASIMFIYFLNTIPFISKLLKTLLNLGSEKEKKNDNKINLKDVTKALITTISVLLFNFGSDNSKNIKNTTPTSMLGIILLLISLMSDGLLSLKEKKLQSNIENDDDLKSMKNSLCWIYMKTFGFFTIIFCVPEIIYNCIFGDYLFIIKMCFTNFNLSMHILIYAICEAMGQSILFIYLNKYGPLSLSMVTSVRKILTITISIIYFRKPISFTQIISLILASSVVLSEIFDKKKVSSEKENKKSN